MFFDVANRLEHVSLIVGAIIKPDVAAVNLRSSAPQVLWKLYGYFSGPIVLDSLVYSFCSPTRPESADQLNDFWINEAKKLAAAKGALAFRHMAINWETQIEIANLFFRMLELEKETEGGRGSQIAYEDNVRALLDNLPWRPYQLIDASDDTKVKKLEQKGACLRADELAIIGIDNMPAGLNTLLESMQFPEN